MKTRAIIFDIDGTAVDSPKQKLPSARLVSAVRKLEEDYFISAATGRVWTFAKPVIQDLALTDPCIISAGTQICDPATGDILWQCDIDPTDLKSAISILENYPKYKVLFNEFEESDYLEGGINVSGLSITDPVYFFAAIFVPSIEAPEIIAKLSQIEGIAATLVVAQKPGFNDIHITARDATKEHAVAELLKIIGLNKQGTIAIGDGHNDVHLFNAVEKKIAMGNAVEELKEASDMVIDSVSNDGLAIFLESLSNDGHGLRSIVQT